MRIWDINPGYLNRQSLLGEHRELHGLVSIMVNGKKGYSQHPETLRWVGFGWAIRQRHIQLVCEMNLRGYQDKTPVYTRSKKGAWPSVYIDDPDHQFKILQQKYINKEAGRIVLPINEQQLWAQHKYSVLARDPEKYRQIGRDVCASKIDFEQLSRELVELLRVKPEQGGIRNALHHMWGYVSEVQTNHHRGNINAWSLKKLLLVIQENSIKSRQQYLINSTALSELMVWL